MSASLRFGCDDPAPSFMARRLARRAVQRGLAEILTMPVAAGTSAMGTARVERGRTGWLRTSWYVGSTHPRNATFASVSPTAVQATQAPDVEGGPSTT